MCCVVKEELHGGIFFVLHETTFPQRWTKLGTEFWWVSKTPAQASPAGSHLQPPPATSSQSQDNKTQSSLAMGQILPGKTLLTSRGSDEWLIRTVGFVSIFYWGCNAESPSGQWGWSGAVKAPGLLGGEQVWEWPWALGNPVRAARGRSRNVGMALPGHGTPVPLGTRVLPLPFPPRGSQASREQEGREDFCDWGSLAPLSTFSSGWVGERSQNISISKMKRGSVKTETFLEGFLKKQGSVFSAL